MGVYINKAELLKELSVIQDRPVHSATQIIKVLPTIDLVKCGECIHFHYDKLYIIQGISVLGHEVCDFWGSGCKTNPNAFCSYGERRTNERI